MCTFWRAGVRVVVGVMAVKAVAIREAAGIDKVLVYFHLVGGWRCGNV